MLSPILKKCENTLGYHQPYRNEYITQIAGSHNLSASVRSLKASSSVAAHGIVRSSDLGDASCAWFGVAGIRSQEERTAL